MNARRCTSTDTSALKEIDAVTTHITRPERRFHSRDWFDDPERIDQTALYLERFMNYGTTPEELRTGKPIIGIAQTGNDLSRPATGSIWILRSVYGTECVTLAGSPWSSPCTRPSRIVAGPPPRWTTILPTWAWWKSCTAVPLTRWC
jgi:hypothetical protein